ncbi:MAG: hypothetical protein ACPGU4_12390 [Flavobacteriales bacterium]
MKLGGSVFAILFLAVFSYLAWNHFELPHFFWFQDTKKVKGVVTKVSPFHTGRGWYVQLTEYQYQVEDSIYSGTFKAGRSEGIQTVGDSISVNYAVDNPAKSEVVGFYRLKRNGNIGHKSKEGEKHTTHHPLTLIFHFLHHSTGDDKLHHI